MPPGLPTDASRAAPGGPSAASVVARLAALGVSVGTAESLTGGLLCAALVDVPGASAVVRGGVVSYATQVKQDVLGIPAGLLHHHGTVSRECAEAMAAGALPVLGADWAVSTTGVAGPGPSEGRQVGTVHVAVAGVVAGEQITAHRAFLLHGDRAAVRTATVTQALRLLLDTLPTPVSDEGCTVGDQPVRTAGDDRPEEG